MAAVDIFQTIKTGQLVEQAVIDHIEAWIEVYLKEIALQLGEDPSSPFPVPRSYNTFSSLDHLSEDQIPAVVVVSPGLASLPRAEGDGSYTATWEIHVSTFVSGMDIASTNYLSRIYAAAIRSIVVQKPSLGGVATDSVWLDERYDDLGSAGERTLATGSVSFAVSVEDVINRQGGPRTYPFIDPPDPIHQPGSQWPVAEEVITTATSEGVGE